MKPINKEIVIKASVEDIWSYFTDSHKIEKWLMPNNFKPELHRKFEFKCVEGDCDVNVIECELVEIIPFEKLVFTWYASNIGAETKVTISLEETGVGTKIKLIHEGWDKLPPDVKHTRDEYDNGWDLFITEKLKSALLS